MPEEIGNALEHLKNIKEKKFGDLTIFSGEWSSEIFITIAWSGWGKVSAARATTRLLSCNLNSRPIDFILFTGVAGGADPFLKQWDVIISTKVIQHDMDARPMFPKFVVPAIKNEAIRANKHISDLIYKALTKENKIDLKPFGNVLKGLIATGDKFISEKKFLKQLRSEIQNLKAVEMEGAAFAQVAFQEKIPWCIIRVISDEADENAAENFQEFLEKYEKSSWKLIEIILKNIENYNKNKITNN